MSIGGATTRRALVLFCNAVWNPALSWLKILLARPVSPLPWPPWLGDLPSAVTDQESVTSSLHLPSRHRQLSMLGQRQPNKQCEFVDVGGGHKARLLLRRTTIGAQSVAKTMHLLVGNLTAAVVGNHLKTAIQRLHISNSQIRACCLGKAQAKVQLNSLRMRMWTVSVRMVRWCVRLTRLTLVCEVIRYRLVQVRQNLKKSLS